MLRLTSILNSVQLFFFKSASQQMVYGNEISNETILLFLKSYLLDYFQQFFIDLQVFML